MKKLRTIKDMSLQIKLPIMIGTASFVVLTIASAILMVDLRSSLDDVPASTVCASVNSVIKMIILFILFCILLIMAIVWLISSEIAKQVNGITAIIRQVSTGRLDIQIGNNLANDELGQMKKELGVAIEGLQRMSAFADSIVEGDFGAGFWSMGNNDVLGNALLEIRNHLRNANEECLRNRREEEKRNWVSTGLDKFAEILKKDNKNPDVLSYNIISNLVKYLEAKQGGIFILNETDNEKGMVLELKACYAFDRKKLADKQIYPGEGLVGTCFLDGETMYMTDIPDEYINITSGLGDATPKVLLLCPLKVNDEVFGVIEMASFRAFEPYQLDFVEKVSANIAATLFC